jgi:branched-chain amino acid transport system permease protein
VAAGPRMRAGLKVARATKLILTAKSMEIFGIPLPAMLSQLLLGLVNGSFYAILSLGLAVIFGLLNVINFAHGALFMLGAMLAWMGLSYFGLPYWAMLVLAPLIVGAFGIAIERRCCAGSTSSITSTGCCSRSASRW